MLYSKKIKFILFKLVISFIVCDITEILNFLGAECSDLGKNDLLVGIDESLPAKPKLDEPGSEPGSTTTSPKKNSGDESPVFRSIDASLRKNLEKFEINIDIEALERDTDDETSSKKDCNDDNIVVPEPRRATLDSVVGTKRKASFEESPFQEFHSAPESAFRPTKKPK
jgi:hypothetical protein